MAEHSLLRRRLDRLYVKYNRPEFLQPDPLQVVFDYENPADQEVVALLAAGLAYGRVASILKGIESVLQEMGPSPARFLRESGEAELARAFVGFRYRWTTRDELQIWCRGVGRILREYGNLEACFLAGSRCRDRTVLPALQTFHTCLIGEEGPNSLLPDPRKNSSCKRLHMFLRWMIRDDAIDPGLWSGLPASRLIVPLDVHMFRLARRLGFTRRKQANLAAVLEITERFRVLRPRDPVRYDFALTRLGIRDDCSIDEWSD